MSDKIRVGIVGAGFIAPWHANAISRVPNIEITGVCDYSLAAANRLADIFSIEGVYTSIDELLVSGTCDAVHILTPPNAHFEGAQKALQRGLHVLVEKPFTLDPEESAALESLARERDLALAVDHNFLALPSYKKLKKSIKDGDIGRIDSLEINWRYPLTPLRSGPFGLWLIREPTNLLFELGPHLFAFSHDLVGDIQDIDVRMSKNIELPSGLVVPQCWQILGRAGDVDVTVNISLVEGYDDRILQVRGVCGKGILDYNNDTLEIRRSNTADIIINPLTEELSSAANRLSVGVYNAAVQLKSLNRLSPYALSINGAVRAFYDAVKNNTAVDDRFSASSATAITRTIAAATKIAKEKLLRSRVNQPDSGVAPTKNEHVLVIGGTGFIGRSLVNRLAREGYRIRVFSRGQTNIFNRISESVSVFTGNLKSEDDLREAMKGVDYVFHLARSDEKTWEGYISNDVDVSKLIGVSCVKENIKRLIYTGSIASYNTSVEGSVITEDTGFEGDLTDRNFYARSKAMGESVLLSLSRNGNLPLVIVRPGIVVGKSGPLQHWGIGRWNGSGACKLWGSGENMLPFVLVGDVADGMLRMMTTPDIDGSSFNLIGDPMLSAKGYFDAIHEKLGVRINVQKGTSLLFYLSGAIKYFLKKHILRKKGIILASRKDCKSRLQYAIFDNKKSKTILGWNPESDKERFIQKAIVESDLFGF